MDFDNHCGRYRYIRIPPIISLPTAGATPISEQEFNRQNVAELQVKSLRSYFLTMEVDLSFF